MILVVDASVAIKWFFRSPPEQENIEKALAILEGIQDCNIEMQQPPHFIAEVAAVLAREKPDEALADLDDLLNIDFKIIEAAAIYTTATELSIRFNHHLFDTLYHATALHNPKAHFVTTDRRYYEKAKAMGQIVFLGEFQLSKCTVNDTAV